jgi:hypothetical protein
MWVLLRRWEVPLWGGGLFRVCVLEARPRNLIGTYNFTKRMSKQSVGMAELPACGCHYDWPLVRLPTQTSAAVTAAISLLVRICLLSLQVEQTP